MDIESSPWQLNLVQVLKHFWASTPVGGAQQGVWDQLQLVLKDHYDCLKRPDGTGAGLAQRCVSKFGSLLLSAATFTNRWQHYRAQ